MDTHGKNLRIALLVLPALALVPLRPGVGLAVEATLTDDAFTSAEAPTENFGARPNLRVQGGAVHQRTFLKFNLSTLPPSTTAEEVGTATLRLWVSLGSGDFDVKGVKGRWSEETITHATAPALAGAVATAVATQATSFVTVDVTSLVRQWLAGTMANNGLALVPVGGVVIRFDSKENTITSHEPRLEIALGTNSSNANTAIGAEALLFNTTGSSNTAIGDHSLSSNTTGENNTATGGDALGGNTTGVSNTATGALALQNNTTGNDNTAVGSGALVSNTTGSSNTAIGVGADVSAGDLTNATAIGNGALVDASNKIRLGNSLVTVIEAQVGLTVVSDKTKKENFQPVDGDEVLGKIRGLPVTSWNFIGHDPRQFRHYGPAAQDFFAAFGHDGIGTVGTPTTITASDMEGILVIAIQALERRASDQREKIKSLTAENADLRAWLERLERRISAREVLWQR